MQCNAAPRAEMQEAQDANALSMGESDGTVDVHPKRE
jgi:hypothetical protein